MKKTVLITGASSGIGEALAYEACTRGMQVGLMARNAQNLEKVAEKCRELGAKVMLFTGDVSIENDCKQFIENAVEYFGNIDILINNAGMSMRAVFAQTDLQVLHKLMNINFWGTVYCTKYAMPQLLANKGSVVGISSIAGFKGLPGRTGYSASKFAMQGFLESLRNENIKTGLHVLIACPGYTASNIRNTAINHQGQAQGETPLNEDKLMQPKEVAEKVMTAIEKRKLYLIMTAQGKIFVFINKFFQKLADKLAYNLISKEKDSPFT